MTPQVNLDSVTPVVVAPFGTSGVKFATDVTSKIRKAGVEASIDRRTMHLCERLRTLWEAGGRIFCGVGDEEVQLQIVRLKVDGGRLTRHMNIDFAIDFIRAGLEREPVREPAEAPRPPDGAEPS